MRRSWGRWILLSLLTGPFPLRAAPDNPENPGASRNAGDVFLTASQALYPPVISNLTAVESQGQTLVFFDQSPMTGSHPPNNGDTRSFVINLASGLPPQPFSRINDAVAAGGKIWALSESGYATFDGSAWSDFQSRPQWTQAFGCAVEDDLWVFYIQQGNLLADRWHKGRWENLGTLQRNWPLTTLTHSSSLLGSVKPRSVYYKGRIYFFGVKDDLSKLVFQSVSPRTPKDWTALHEFGFVDGYSPVSTPTGLTVFYRKGVDPGMVNLKHLWGMIKSARLSQNLYFQTYDGMNWNSEGRIDAPPSQHVGACGHFASVDLFLSDGTRISRVSKNGDATEKAVTLFQVTPQKPPLSALFTAGAFTGVFTVIGLIMLAAPARIVSDMVEAHKPAGVTLNGNRYQCASLFRRYCGLAVDFCFMSLLNWLLIYPLLISHTWETSLWSWPLIFFYLWLSEARFGKTLGKWVCKTQVLSEDGTPPGLKRSLIRNAIKFLDGLFAHIPCTVAFAASAKHQHLGDMASRLFVVNAIPLSPPQPPDNPKDPEKRQ